MGVDDVDESAVADDEDERAKWIEVAILCSITMGISIDEVAESLSVRGNMIDSAEIAKLTSDLARRGLLRDSAASTGAPYEQTDRGRRWFLAQIGAWIADAAEMDAERRVVGQLRLDLMSTVSHELRTPLTLVRTSIGLLLDSSPDEDMLLRLLHNIKRSSDRMDSLINDFLNLVQLHGDRFPLRIRDVAVDSLAESAISLMRPLLDTKRQTVTLTIPTPPPIIPGDYRQIERVLLNLLGNANKFAPAGSEVTVKISESAREVTIAVRDAGPGISAASMPHLFDWLFVAAVRSSPHSVGSGLGLPIAKGIVEAHGGRMWVESVIGTGTTVLFTLPKVSMQEKLGEVGRS